jgi:hypothetical protein
MKKSHLLLYLGLILFTPITSFSQNLSIQGKLNRSEIKTGEQAVIDLTIRTNNLPQTQFYLKEEAQKEAPYTVIALVPVDTVDISSRIKEISAKLVLTSFDSTLITIPPIVAKTPTDSAETAPMGLKVIQPEVDSKHPSNFKDIKAPWDVSLSLKDWLILILSSWIFWVVIAVLVGFYIAYRVFNYYQSKKANPTPQIQVRELSLIEKTEAALLQLEQQQLIEQELFKEFYSELITIFKFYLNESYSWTTTEMTSNELMKQMSSAELSSSEHEMLRLVLTEADLSKFAKYTPSSDNARLALSQIRQLVRELHRKGLHSSTDI